MIKIETPQIQNPGQNNQNKIQDQNQSQNKLLNDKIVYKNVIIDKAAILEERKKKSGKYKSLKFFKNLMIAPKNKATLKEIYQSLETIRNFEMSTLKKPPNYLDDNLNIENKEQNKKLKHVNYPLSAIGLLKCDYGNGLIIYGTGT